MGNDKKRLSQALTVRIITSACLLVAFAVFTVAVTAADVRPVGADGTDIGFAGLNTAVRDAVGYSPVLFAVSEYLGYIALAVMAFFAGVGLVRLIRGRSLKAVGSEIWLTGGFYVLLLAVYLLFEKLEINYRPLKLEGELEASYPSSHTVLALCVFLSAALLFAKLLASKPKAAAALQIAMTVLALATVVTRFASGVHWFTDIIGGVILSALLLSLYSLAGYALGERSAEES